MSRPKVPSLHIAGRWWSSDHVASIARGFLASIQDRIDDGDVPCAVALPSTARGLALFIAASARTAVAPVLPADPAHWPDRHPLFAGMPLALLPEQATLAGLAEARGFAPLLLADGDGGSTGALDILRTPGFVIQTSGSTGAPKAVFRPTSHLVMGATVRATALGLAAGDGLLGGVPFSSGQGVVQVVTAIVLGGALGMVGPVDYREVLSAVSMPEFACWRVTAHFADVLSRVPLARVPRPPRVCLTSSPICRPVFDAFRSRFGVPLRGSYSSTETGAIAVDAAPQNDVGPGTVGSPLPGVEIVVGEMPASPVAPGTVSRLWARSPWQMRGYGIPPLLERPGDVDGFWPTRDLASIDERGRLRLAGRVDHCVRTRDGRLVNLEAVASALRDVEGVGEAVVLPLDGSAGPTFGAVLECRPSLTIDALRRAIASTLPAWALPRSFRLVDALPRLPNRKPDRVSCLRLLSDPVEPRS